MKSLTIHHTPEPHPDIRIPDPHQDTFSKATLGFWTYLMTDCILFATLFATYAVLHNNTSQGPSARDLFNLSTPFIETLLLLFSSVSCGCGLLSALQDKKNQVIAWLIVTFLLGSAFIGIEMAEFTHLISEGNSWKKSAFLSSFFALVGTHGFHVSIGLLWMFVLMAQVWVLGITLSTFRRLVIFGMFWHFLDLIWIFIFTFVYLIGVSVG